MYKSLLASVIALGAVGAITPQAHAFDATGTGNSTMDLLTAADRALGERQLQWAHADLEQARTLLSNDPAAAQPVSSSLVSDALTAVEHQDVASAHQDIAMLLQANAGANNPAAMPRYWEPQGSN